MNTSYKQCTHCGAPIKLTPASPHDSSGGTLWSDGYLETSGSPEPPILGKCRACEAIGYLAELPAMESASPPTDGADYTFVPLTVNDYALLLDNLQGISRQFHLYLRIRFWQLNNHPRRGKDNASPLSDVERANLIALLKLLGEEDASRLMKAEILRQLREFEGAEAVLNDVFNDIFAKTFDERFTLVVERLRRLITDRDSRIMKIYPIDT